MAFLGRVVQMLGPDETPVEASALVECAKLEAKRVRERFTQAEQQQQVQQYHHYCTI